MAKAEQKETEATLEASRMAWRHINEVMASPVSDREKLEKCQRIADVHCAMTGDDSIVAPLIREARNKFISGLDRMLKASAYEKKHRDEGKLL